MSWEDVIKLISCFLAFFGGVWGLSKYVMDKNEAVVNLKAQHQKDIEGLKEKNSDKVMTRLEKEIADLKAIVNAIEIRVTTAIATVTNQSGTMLKVSEELMQLRIQSEKRLAVIETQLIAIGGGKFIVKGKST